MQAIGELLARERRADIKVFRAVQQADRRKLNSHIKCFFDGMICTPLYAYSTKGRCEAESK